MRASLGLVHLLTHRLAVYACQYQTKKMAGLIGRVGPYFDNEGNGGSYVERLNLYFDVTWRVLKSLVSPMWQTYIGTKNSMSRLSISK